MGIYVYSMRKPVKNVELGHTGGRDVYEIARLQFLVKTSDVMESKTAKMQVLNCENRFPVVPQYAVQGDKWENGMEVYRWMGAKPWGYDTPSLPMYKIGTLDLPVLRVKLDPVVSMAFRYVPVGGQFTMGENFLQRFNREVIAPTYQTDPYSKGVTDYTPADVFEMTENGDFVILRNGVRKAYRVIRLPHYYSEWTVRVDMGNGDRTNELEAIYS